MALTTIKALRRYSKRRNADNYWEIMGRVLTIAAKPANIVKYPSTKYGNRPIIHATDSILKHWREYRRLIRKGGKINTFRKLVEELFSQVSPESTNNEAAEEIRNEVAKM